MGVERRTLVGRGYSEFRFGGDGANRQIMPRRTGIGDSSAFSTTKSGNFVEMNTFPVVVANKKMFSLAWSPNEHARPVVSGVVFDKFACFHTVQPGRNNNNNNAETRNERANL